MLCPTSHHLAAYILGMIQQNLPNWKNCICGMVCPGHKKGKKYAAVKTHGHSWYSSVCACILCRVLVLPCTLVTLQIIYSGTALYYLS